MDYLEHLNETLKVKYNLNEKEAYAFLKSEVERMASNFYEDAARQVEDVPSQYMTKEEYRKRVIERLRNISWCRDIRALTMLS